MRYTLLYNYEQCVTFRLEVLHVGVWLVQKGISVGSVPCGITGGSRGKCKISENESVGGCDWKCCMKEYGWLRVV